MNLKDRAKLFIQSLIPARRVTIYDRRQDPAYMASSLDVDALHGILREAEGGNAQRLFALYRDVILGDAHTQTEFTKRKLAVLGEVFSCLPDDKTLEADKAAALFCEKQATDLSNWIFACSYLLDGTIWPVAVVEKVYRARNGRYELAELVQVDPQLLDYSTGNLQIRDTDPATGVVLGTIHAPDPERYIVHRGHLLTTADNWGGPLRSILFWWLLGNMDRDWWARFLDRFGSPFLVGKYPQSDDQSRTILERAFGLATRLGGLVVSTETEVEIKQAASQSAGEAFEKFHTIAQREKSKLILGQTLSAEAQSTGLGSGVANTQADVRSDFRVFDSRMLAHTLRTQLFAQLCRINALEGSPPRPVWGSESGKGIESLGVLMTALTNAGLRISDDSLEILSERAGLSIERMPATGSPGGFPFALMPLAATPPSTYAAVRSAQADAANERIARDASADLSQAFRGSLAPVRKLILESTSPEDLERRIQTYYADWKPGKVAVVLEQALTAYAANGVIR